MSCGPPPPPVREQRSSSQREGQPLSSQQLFNNICRAVVEADDFQESIYRNISPSTGFLVASLLETDPRVERARPRVHYNSATQILRVRIMPTEILDYRHLDISVGTTLQGFSGTYSSSSKEPDLFISPGTQDLPSVVVESGWSESWPYLHQDMHLWLAGGAPTVQLVLLLRWSKTTSNRVGGVLEVYGRDPAGAVILLENETILITRGQIFGARVFPGRNANDIYQLSIYNLRPLAMERLQKMGLNPA
ncbi:hypothetical protein M432DRAFT_634610 [Thermoascus aurantiacus ATCC 26904]